MSTEKVGAVMVVGAGIAGIQASLDLAESGYYVYLVESSPAIGGTMPMLDKTFPTNDCSMCILSPKLVQCGRHLNIKSYTCSDIMDVSGEPGKFKVKIRQRARYVDIDKCKACSECSQACPVEIPNEFNRELENRKAVYKRYAQAYPNAFVIDKRGVSPCKAACPAGVNSQGYVQLIKKGKFTEAWQMVYRDNPFPAACGRICTHPCQSVCHRGSVDGAVNIMRLKRFAADYAYNNMDELPLPVIEEKNGEKVAVVGAGPAGLSAAYQLTKRGYEVTVFEALPVAGGMLRVGIPEYRLPKKWVDLEVDLLKRMGVEIKLNTPINSEFTIKDILARGYKAVFLSVGAQRGIKLRVPGEDQEGVIPAVDMLRQMNLGEKVDIAGKVIVIGGGNVAMDAARSSVRLGAKEVHVYSLESLEEMPASVEEIEAAKEEGVVFHHRKGVKAILGENGRVTGLETLNVSSVFDIEGRFNPQYIEGTEESVDADRIVIAAGQSSELSFLGEDLEKMTVRGRLKADRQTLATEIPGVFAGGDALTGPRTAVEAVGAGKEAAESIDRYIKGIDLVKDRVFSIPEEEIAPLRQNKEDIEIIQPVEVIHVDPAVRAASFEEESTGYTAGQAQREAERCLNCGGCSECLECEKACLAGAINHSMKDEEIEFEVGAVVLCPGFEPFNSKALPYYGYGKYPNVLTSLDFERILSASGPFQGHLVRPYDHKEPKRIAWIQCVGSRNTREEKDYCSSVCCMYAIKEAVIAKEHCKYPLETTIFYMDMRTYGKGFEKYYNRAENENGVRFVRSRIYEVTQLDDEDKTLSIRYSDEDGNIHTEEFDLVVLSVGMNPSPSVVDLAGKMGVSLNRFGFAQPLPLTGISTNKPGVYVAGSFSSPMDIPETVMQASATVGAAGGLLSESRGTLVKEKVYPPEKDVSGQEPRIGVFVCHCGINIGGVVNVPEVVEMAKKLPYVVHAEDNLYTCSQDTQARMREMIEEHGINRVIVASCSPRTHKPLFQETMLEAGLNRFLFEMANIRDQCSWVHMYEPEKATEKAKDLVRMAVSKAALLQAIHKKPGSVTKSALVIGGGVAGLNSALSMAEQDFKVYLVEKEDRLGGLANRINYSLTGENVREYLADLIGKVESNPNIVVYKGTEVQEVSGYVGNFKTTLNNGDRIEHGVVIISVGGQEYKPTEYLYGQNDRVMTQMELEDAIVNGSEYVTGAKNVVFIQCVGSREPGRAYCSRFCCTKSIKLALEIKEKNPAANVFVLYRDIRTYGMNEQLYTRARRSGVIFIRYNVDDKPVVVQDEKGNLKVTVRDHVLGVPVEINADVLGLAVAALPARDNPRISTLFKIPINEDGFFLEAHMKLRPVDFASEGVFMAGLAHSPKNLDENIAQAKAAVGRAATILAKDKLESHNVVAVVQTEKCAACYTCVRLCPFNAPRIVNNAAQIETVLCQGCGTCAGECPNKAITLQGYSDKMYMSMVDELFKEVDNNGV
ncbi:MAG: FAD-dependent oxidoreductase [Bacillota bacterium]